MRRLKVWLPAAVLAGALAVGAAAAIAPRDTTPVIATLGANRIALQERTCSRGDGEYRQANEAYAGSLAGDPRLTAGIGSGGTTWHPAVIQRGGCALGPTDRSLK